MLNDQMNKTELEENIRQQIRQDISVSIQQLDTGEGLLLAQVMKDIRCEYA